MKSESKPQAKEGTLHADRRCAGPYLGQRPPHQSGPPPNLQLHQGRSAEGDGCSGRQCSCDSSTWLGSGFQCIGTRGVTKCVLTSGSEGAFVCPSGSERNAVRLDRGQG